MHLNHLRVNYHFVTFYMRVSQVLKNLRYHLNSDQNLMDF